MKNNLFDVVIIGAGPAGLTSALYSLRANLSVALVDNGLPGGQMNNTLEIENYPGYKTISGEELSEKMFEQIEDYSNLNYVFDKVVNIKDYEKDIKEVHLSNNEILKTKSIIIASGTTHKKLNVSGEEELNSKGVSYCAICDGNFFKDKEVIVVGGGDSALEEALYLSKLVKKVYIVHRRDEFRAQKIYQERVFNTSNIELILNSNVVSINGKNKVESVTIKDSNNNCYIKNIDGIFIYVGLIPNTSFIDTELKTNEGFIITDNDTSTKYKGIFATGDVRDKKLRQVSTAIGDGAISGQEIYNYLNSL